MVHGWPGRHWRSAIVEGVDKEEMLMYLRENVDTQPLMKTVVFRHVGFNNSTVSEAIENLSLDQVTEEDWQRR